MIDKHNTTTLEYIKQLTAILKKNNVQDIDDIVTDYQDYFVQSKAKGYSEIEAIRRLPTPKDLAASYIDSSAESGQIRTSIGRPSSAQRITLFGITLAGDVIVLPVLGITILLLVCFGIVGLMLILTGPLLFMPDSMLGQVDIPRPSFAQLLPAAFLFISSGVSILGLCIAICERAYSAYRSSIVVRRWLLTGRHSNQLKLVPSVSKRFRSILYIVTLLATGVALITLLILASISWLTQGTVNFLSTWKL